MTTNTTEQKLPDWWDEFCEALRTRTLYKYEIQNVEWRRGPNDSWVEAGSYLQSIYENPAQWQFRTRTLTRTVTIDGVDFVLPVLAGDVMPGEKVWPLHRDSNGFSDGLPKCFLVFTSKKDRDAMRAALLGVKL